MNKNISKKILSVILTVLTIVGLVPMNAMAAVPDKDNVGIFPASEMSITQLAYENYSHGHQNAIDFVTSERVVAPFDGTIAYIDPAWGYVTIQSKEPLLLPDGTTSHLTVGLMHDSDVSDLWVGMELVQGQPFYDAGGMGDWNPWAYGAHVHMTVHRGKVTRGYPYGSGDLFVYESLFIDPDFTTSYSGRGKGYAVSGMKNGANSDYSDLWKYIYEYRSSRDVSFVATVTQRTKLYSVPGISSTYSFSQSTRTVDRGTELDIVAVVENKVAGHWWYMTSDGDYVYWENTNFHWYNAVKCEITPIDTTVKTTKWDTKLWDMACSDSTHKDADVVLVVKKGQELRVVSKIVNTAGNVWLLTESGLFVFAGNTTYKG